MLISSYFFTLFASYAHATSILFHRVKLLKQKDIRYASLQWRAKLHIMVQQLEVCLYRSAPSFEAYSDTSTLKTRLHQLAMEFAKNGSDGQYSGHNSLGDGGGLQELSGGWGDNDPSGAGGSDSFSNQHGNPNPGGSDAGGGMDNNNNFGMPEAMGGNKIGGGQMLQSMGNMGLPNYDNSGGATGLTEDQKQERQRNIQLHIALIKHASRCSSPQCTSSNCQKMKSYLKHGQTCKVSST